MNDVLFNQKLREYIDSFESRWPHEKWKWKAPKQFENFDIQSADLSANLNLSINNKCLSNTVSPRNMLIKLAEARQDLIKEALEALFDERNNLKDKVQIYLEKTKEAWEYSNNNLGTSYKTSGQTNITALELLYLKYPTVFYEYKRWIANATNDYFGMGYNLKTDKNTFSHYANAFKMFDEVCNKLIANDEFKQLIDSHITDSEYSDPGYHVATIDFCVFVGLPLKNKNKEEGEEEEDIALEESDDGDSDFDQLVFDWQNESRNKIYYGIPGCGKSFEVDKFIKEKLGIDDNSYRKIRTTFYLDYSYNDFVGQIMPKAKDDKLVYEVNPGPFTSALWAAYLEPDLPVALVIEEINRGNAPAIFGDIFQLLDRDDSGESTYSITNPIITQYFDECGLDKMPGNKIKLPKNLFIFATMNSSDQNVFKLDTAFKRRWEMIRMTNASTKSDAKQFNDFNIPGTSTSWVDFVDNVNKKILETGLNEDRQLGYWFLIKKSLAGFNEEEQKTIFANKVLEYLWNDVLKFHEKDILFRSDINTFDDLITDYIKRPKEVFADGVLNEQESQDQSEGE